MPHSGNDTCPSYATYHPVVIKLVHVAPAGVHVIMWGQIDTVSNVLDMTLGIPADTLAATGIKTLPSDYVLPVPVKGSPQAPLVNWAK